MKICLSEKRGEIKQFLNRTLDAGIPSNISIEEKKRLRILNQILLVNIFIPFFFLFLSLSNGLTELIFIESIISITFLFAYCLKGSNKQHLSIFILLFIVPFELLYFPLFVADIGGEYLYFVFIVAGFYFLDKKQQFILLILFVTVMVLISQHIVKHISYPEKYKDLEAWYYFSNMIIAVILISLSANLFKKDTLRFQRIIEKQSEDLKQHVQELENREDMLTRLLKELNHRVENNLQMVSALFTIQTNSSKEIEIREALNAARYRINTITILHKFLSNKEGTLKPNLKNYIHKLVQFALHLSGYEELLELETDVDNVYLTVETTSHIGLIINELLTNTLKYGLNEEQGKNKITIRIKKNTNIIKISVSDTGIGFSNRILEKESDSFGMKLVHTLAQQYNGKVHLCNNKGAQVSITLQIE